MAPDKAPRKSARSVSALITVVPERCITTVVPFSTMVFGIVYIHRLLWGIRTGSYDCTRQVGQTAYSMPLPRQNDAVRARDALLQVGASPASLQGCRNLRVYR